MTIPSPTTGLFAQTKICPPRQRAGQVPRHAIVSALSDGIGHHRLALLTAPAGFGKTAVLSQLLQKLPPGTGWCWISADADDDLPRLLACLTAALDPWDLPWRVAPDTLAEQARQGSNGPRQVAREVAQALISSGLAQGLIIIDDTHRIQQAAVFEWLDALVECLPPHWTLLLSSRVEAPLAIARWRAQGDVLDLRQSHLQFTPDETSHLLQNLGRSLTPDQLQALSQRTQGWAAGLSLLLRSGPLGIGAAKPVQDRHMFDFLASEVLNGLEPGLRQFLLRCSVLPELTAERCAVVSGQAHALQRLDDIERMGLFVNVLDEAELTLQLHDLFRDFLQDRLRKEAADEWPALLQRAADTEPDPVRQVGFLIKAGHWEVAERTLFGLASGMLARGHGAQVQRLVEQFPATWRERSGPLTHLLGLCAWARWDLVNMIQALTRAGELYDQQGQAPAAQEARMLQVLGLAAGGSVLSSYALLEQLKSQPLSHGAQVIAAQASSWHAVAASRFDQVQVPLTQMVELLLAGASPMLWLQSVPLTTFLGLPGTREPLQRYIDGALEHCQGEDPTPLSVMTHILQAALDLWAGDLASATQRLQTAEEDCRWLNQPPNLMGYWSLVQALTQAVLGHAPKAMAAIQTRLASLDDERTSGRKATWLNHFYFTQVRVACILEDQTAFDEAVALIQANPKPDEHAIFLRERATLPARTAEMAQRWDEAASLYQQALTDAQGIDLYGQALETRLRLAHALLMSGQTEAAAEAAQLGMAQAASLGQVGGALFAGPTVLKALAAHHWQDHLTPAQQQTLRDWAQRLPQQPRHGPILLNVPQNEALPLRTTTPTSRHDALTSRELEVLRHMSAGHSNKLIARSLDLSPHTIKRHVANILDKLGVSSRGQAVARLGAPH
ncbi:MAG: LuxR C-terminal-related transcriptional regulator [Aquabacterium sp.]|uniref:LuxR C-terminal-related transcriptional regulator n=1 Tax=Aquabacterium sp. TaxID=1872578 RepID=UPI0027178C41|nr:LuxR C-terminal-related transcriptional regulator [Aquabacterium sp.]MDO9003609.1 LuxR C-terminal-related transcriptional regulator [Aquabacterium sp.]